MTSEAALYFTSSLVLGLPQHPDAHRSERPILLAVDQEFGEGAALWVAPELADPVGSLEVGERQDVEKLGAGSGTERVQALKEPALDLGQRRHVRTLP
ncbi:MAG: hypothetical protein ABWY83_01575 [Actinomycetota bacterium]